MKNLLLLILTISFIRASAQQNRDRLVGDWKFYHDDNTSFDFLRLNADGTGIKCTGQTLNGKDTLFADHVSALAITGWKAEKENLVLNSINKLTFKINPQYKLRFVDSDKIELTGEHLMFNIYPSMLNRKLFYRTIVYQKAGKLLKGYGAETAACIDTIRIIKFTAIDAATHLAQYKGFNDLIPHVISCHPGYQYAQKYHDPPYSLVVPTSMNKWSYAYGDKMFYISLNTAKYENAIVIYYDFDNELKNIYFSDVKTGKEKIDIVKVNGLDVYRMTNWEGKHEGRVYLDNFIIVAYYTTDEKLLPLLQKCITSFKYN